MLLCLGRPELLEERPGWGGGKLNATTVLLEPLDAGACEQLLDHLGEGLDPAARARVVEARSCSSSGAADPRAFKEYLPTLAERSAYFAPTVAATVARPTSRARSLDVANIR